VDYTHLEERGWAHIGGGGCVDFFKKQPDGTFKDAPLSELTQAQQDTLFDMLGKDDTSGCVPGAFKNRIRLALKEIADGK
jgi:hypothetical protein